MLVCVLLDTARWVHPTIFFLPHSQLFKGRHFYPVIVGFVVIVLRLLFSDSSLVVDPTQGLLRLLDRG